MSEILIRDALGERRLGANDFPVTVGGEGSTVALAGRDAGAAAYLGLQDGQIFLQPERGRSEEVLHNGQRISGSAWLRPGDVINLGSARLRFTEERGQQVIDVEDGASGNITEPPIIAAGANISGVTEEGDPLAAARFQAASGERAARSPFNVARVALSVGAVVVAAMVWFLFTGIPVSIATNPTNADVDLDGLLPAFKLGNNYLVQPGQYRVRAEQAGYKPREQTVRISKTENQRLVLTLEKLPGLVRIVTPSAAQVSIDGKARGGVPAELEIAPGKHEIQITSERYQPFADEIEVVGEGKKQTYEPKLLPAWAVVEVSSEPAGAQLLVDGEVRGVTPLSTEILAGNRALELRLPGFKPWTNDIQVKANEPQTFGPIQLGLSDGRLLLASTPAGASVTVGGVYRGLTPLTLELRPDVPQNLVIAKPGYQPVTQQLTLKSAEERSLSVPLAGIYGQVTVRAQPSDAQVFVDGKARGKVNQTIELLAVSHEIEVRKAGFVTYKTSVTPRPGLPQVVETTLLTAEQTRFAVLPERVTSKVGPQLKLIPKARYTMGSQRREPGRRANEAQRSVDLQRPFYVGIYEVTNAQYRRFKADHRSGFIGSSSLDLDNQPVVNVSWEEAIEYCNWASEQDGLPVAYEQKNGNWVLKTPVTKGYRLPTEAEWEWVARADRGGTLRKYSWGDVLPVPPGGGNYADAAARGLVPSIIEGYDDTYAGTAPVGKFEPSFLGFYDMGGNASEWTHDYYSVGLETREAAVDPLGPAEGKQHVIRGSSWQRSSIADLRLAVRDFGEGRRSDLGFRIARYAE